MMAGEKKQRRIDQIDGRTVLLPCDFLDDKLLGTWDFYLLHFFNSVLVWLV